MQDSDLAAFKQIRKDLGEQTESTISLDTKPEDNAPKPNVNIKKEVFEYNVKQ